MNRIARDLEKATGCTCGADIVMHAVREHHAANCPKSRSVKPLIIGEAPSKNEYPPSPIAGRIGKRLAACAGMTLPQFLEAFDRTNLLYVRQDTREKGFEFDYTQAKLAAKSIYLQSNWMQRPYVLLLGKRVSKSFDVTESYLEEVNLHGVKAFVVPHPSGVNRWWNDKDNEKRMYDFMMWLVTEVGV